MKSVDLLQAARENGCRAPFIFFDGPDEMDRTPTEECGTTDQIPELVHTAGDGPSLAYSRVFRGMWSGPETSCPGKSRTPHETIITQLKKIADMYRQIRAACRWRNRITARHSRMCRRQDHRISSRAPEDDRR
ncbi:hypothetical protein [uncultured Methanofollis sp.]|uniref:hypothetical protein n=1 Tax=uncultured Methanofollis sp. TaxID=262500 RepID=UPI002631778F|nr:hypothetical protein [uncultured Methanofollis sp.]